MFEVRFLDGSVYQGEDKESLVKKKTLPGILRDLKFNEKEFINCPWRLSYANGKPGVVHIPSGEFVEGAKDDEVLQADNPESLRRVIWERREGSLTREIKSLLEGKEYYHKKWLETLRLYGDLDECLRKIGDLNERGDPDSRKAVRDLLASQGIIPCEECGHYVCICD